MASVFDLTKLIAVSALSIFLVACGKPEAATNQAPPPPSVDVAEVLLERITETDVYTGRLQAPQTVMVVPRVSGYIEQVLFNEGSLVEKGEVLFKIDSRIFAAEVARLEALQAVNPAIRDEEINFFKQQMSASAEAIGRSTVQLEAIRVVVTS